MDPLERVIGLEWQGAGQQLIEDHSQGIAIGAGVQALVDAAALFGCEVGKRGTGGNKLVPVAEQLFGRGDAEQQHLPACRQTNTVSGASWP